jgi:hypothetical protein
VDLEAPDEMIDIVPALTRVTRPEYDLPALSRGPIYQTCYTLAREEARARRTAEEVRALLLPLIEGAGELADAAREALERALAGRPPKYRVRPEP